MRETECRRTRPDLNSTAVYFTSRSEIGELDLVEDEDWWTRPGRGSRLVDSTGSTVKIIELDRKFFKRLLNSTVSMLHQ